MDAKNKNPNRPKGRGIFNVVNSLKYLACWFMNPFTASSGEFSTIKIFAVSAAFMLFLPLIFIILFYLNIDHIADYNTSMPKNFTVAFIGDHGLGNNAKEVLRLIKNENADMVLHQGDFDYENNPGKWDQQINEILGPEFPYFASIGNHELVLWKDYQKKLYSRLSKIKGAKCIGDLGVASACYYKGLFFILSGVGTRGYGYPNKNIPGFLPWRFRYGMTAVPSQFLHGLYIKRQLAKDDSAWRICSWHKNQRLMQVGGKVDETGWQVYEECRKGGAIIATGHEHSYSRTHLMENFEEQTIASISNTLEIEKGKTFAFVSGLGGKSIRDQVDELASKPWWAAVYTTNQNASYGALFCIFNVDGIENEAYCYFKDIDKNIIDEFDITSHVIYRNSH